MAGNPESPQTGILSRKALPSGGTPSRTQYLGLHQGSCCAVERNLERVLEAGCRSNPNSSTHQLRVFGWLL